MANLFSRKSTPSDKTSDGRVLHPVDPVDELRNLLLGPMQERFDKIQQWMQVIENKELQAEEVCQILPEAILMRASRDKQIVKAMESVTEQAIESSIKRDPQILVSTLVPVMLPAIRKAITTLIKEMIQSFSATLEHGLSFQGLRWRYEAFKSKKPFGEVALLHSLVYQVEQVFLIHKNTGLVLGSVVSKDTLVIQDPDMVSAMLTAIQDFTRDSFGATQDEGLENLQFGDRSIWIEQTPLVIIAAVVFGNAPVELRTILRDALNAIHFENINHLRSFDGDTAHFETAKIHLANCLKSQFQKKRPNPFIFWTSVALLIFCIGYFSFFAIRDHIRWKNYLEKLHEEPGIVVTETDKRSGIYYVYGLRDPLSSNPVEILKGSKIKPEKVTFNWELYQSSHPDFMIRRIKKILNPPETITFTLKEGVLRARGSASHQWILESKKMSEAIPGIIRFENDSVIDLDLKQIDVLKEKTEKTFFFFDAVSTKVKSGQEDVFGILANDIKDMIRLAQIFEMNVHIEIVGHTDSIGTEERNMGLSQKRAEELFSILISKGLKPELFTTKGVASKEPMREELTEQDREYNRCVNFKVAITRLKP